MLLNTLTVNPTIKEIGQSSLEIIELHVGQSAALLLLEQKLICDWDKLYNTCPWASAFQSSGFVNSWYKHYINKYIPIVVTAYKNGELIGLLTMAVLKEKTKQGKLFIVHAGHGEADIQTWLAQPHFSDQFITEALDKILKEFPKTDILLRHIAPHTPIDWASKHPAWVNRCVLESFSRPLIRMKDFVLSRRERKRVSQLLKIATFEVIPDTETFIKYIDEIGVLYDFRHGAMFNRTPFMHDKAYRKLLISLFENKLLAVTVLRNQDQIIASVATTIGRNKAHLGAIICHAPSYASYSPGIVQFLLTSQYFVEHGLDYFDLTPGGDAYKDRLATEYDTVQTLVITDNTRFYMWRNFRNYVQNSLAKAGIDPIDIKLKIRKQRYFFNEKGMMKLWQNFRANKQIKSQLYEVLLGYTLIDSDLLEVKVNALEDLLKYQSADGELTRWEFMEAAMRRLEAGYTAYTFADSTNLYCSVWLKPSRQTESQMLEANLGHEASILCELHVSAMAKEIEASFLISVLRRLPNENSPSRIFIELKNKRIYQQLRLEKAEDLRPVSE